MDNYYDSIAQGYEELHREEQEAKIAIIKQFINPLPEQSLLDVGCGTGITTHPWNCRRFGIDPAKKLLERAHEKNKIEYKLAAAEKIPYEDDSFDYVISVTAIQNFADIKKGLQEIRRVGKKSFVLTFLKNSGKAKIIEGFILEMFIIKKRIEEDKDIIIIAEK